jgi:hypothetical protein
LPYINPPASSSSSTFSSPTIQPIPAPTRPHSIARKSSNLRVPDRPRSSGGSGTASKDTKNNKTSQPPADDPVTEQLQLLSPSQAQQQRIRTNPRLPHDKDVELAPATIMYWSRAPVYGALPMRSMRAHSVTLVDSVAWLFGGCDDKECSKDIYCFDTGTTSHFWCRVGQLTDMNCGVPQKRCSGRTQTHKGSSRLRAGHTRRH